MASLRPTAPSIIDTKQRIDVSTKENQYQESSFLYICQRPGLPNLFRFVVTHTQAHMVVRLNDHLTKGTVLPLAQLEIVTP